MHVDVERSGDEALVTLAGELDTASSRSLRLTLASLVDDGVKVLRVRAAALSFLDAAGLGVLIGVARRLREVGGSLHLESASRQVSRVVALSGVALD
ncbi:MAG TPA: STAS domain-containing protein [Acidimicrobiales bacterium]|nr:STAS domain-containing protein [Acidimicrobiales bacterium]